MCIHNLNDTAINYVYFVEIIAFEYVLCILHIRIPKMVVLFF